MPTTPPSVALTHTQTSLQYDGDTDKKILRHWFTVSDTGLSTKPVVLRIDLIDAQGHVHGQASVQLKRMGIHIQNPIVHADQPYSETPVEFHYYTVAGIFGKKSDVKKVYPEGKLDDLTWREDQIRASKSA